jgi:type IV secretory pathway TraG/TraD family ATPase VirD4
MAVSTTALHGVILDHTKLPQISGQAKVNLPGIHQAGNALLSLDDDILSKHLLLVGGTGSGKTNLFNFMIEQLRRALEPDDVMIIFDTKGDFFDEFFREGDYLISNTKKHIQYSSCWNILKEISADGWDDHDLMMNSQEIARSLFKEVIEKSNSQPFFPIAARDLLAAIFLQMMRIGKDDHEFRSSYLVNEQLKKYFDIMTAQKLIDFLKESPDLASVLSYIGDGTTGQGLGVIAELQSVVREVFVGAFARRGGFSVREFVRGKGGKVLFVEYDLAIGSTLTPIYRLIFDLALKEALGRNKSEGNVYLVCDEFKLLPHSQHIDDGVNFGRSLGVKVMAGLQSIEQLYEIYGHIRGKNIASGFSTIIAFRPSDSATRKYLSGFFGENIVLDQYRMLNNEIVQNKRKGFTVEDWDMTGLQVGEAIVGLPFAFPFKYKFDLYQKGR